jgi:hypothetical protein
VAGTHRRKGERSTEMMQTRQRKVFSSTSNKQRAGGGPGSPGPEAAVAVVCEDGVAGELDGGSEGRRDLV